MRRWGIMAASVALVVLSACGGSGSKKAVAGGATPSSTAAVAGAANTTTAPPSTAAPHAGGSNTTAAKSGAAAGSAKSAAASPAAPGANPPGGSSKVGAVPGTYFYDVTGTATGGTPPQSKDMNSKAKTVADPVNGASQHFAVQDDKGTTQLEQTFQYGSSMVQLLDMRINSVNKEFRPSPPVEVAPVPYAPGAKWSWDMTSTDGSTTVHGDFAFTGTETVTTVSGQSIDCTILEYTLTYHASYNGTPITVTQTDRVDASEQYHVQVKIHSVSDAGSFGKSDTTSLLESINPA